MQIILSKIFLKREARGSRVLASLKKLKRKTNRKLKNLSSIFYYLQLSY